MVKKTKWHQILTDGGLGDLVCCLVAVDWNVKHYPDIKFLVWVPDYLFLFARHVLPRGTFIRPFSKAKEEFDQTILGMTTEWCTNHTCIRTHPVDYGFHMLSDRHVYDLNEKNYLQIKPSFIDVSKFELPEKYVTICATGIEPVRTMPVKTANDLIDYVISKGYTPVFLGKEKSACGFEDKAICAKSIDLNYDKGINLVNKTSLIESAKIIQDSACYVGMDGGLTHIAGCTDAHILCAYTASHWSHVAPIRKGSQSYKFNPIAPDEHPNAFYQTWSSFKKGNFQRFDGWQDVVNSITADKFITHLEGLL